MARKKRAGVKFTNDLYINFEYDDENGTCTIYKNGVPITQGGGVTPEELAEILQAYVTSRDLNTILLDYALKTDIPDVSNLATKAELTAYVDETELETALEPYAKSTDIPDVSNFATKTELADYVDETELETALGPYAKSTDIPDVSNLATKAELPVIEYGQTAAIQIQANSYVDTNITFTKTFKNVPTIQATLASNSTAAGTGNMVVSVINPTKTGATIRLFNADSATRNPYIRWVAIA